MSQLQVFGTTDVAGVEIISAYASAQIDLLAVVEDPGWYVLGAFFLRVAATARLEVIGNVSSPDLALRCRIFDLALGEPVQGAEVTIVSLSDQRRSSSDFALSAGRVYQFQAEAVGAAGVDRFGVVHVANLF